MRGLRIVAIGTVLLAGCGGSKSIAPAGSSSQPTGSTPSAARSLPSGGNCPSNTANTPGGKDPWGGCFPGPGNTGIPAEVKAVDVSDGTIYPPNRALPRDNHGWIIDGGQVRLNAPDAVVDGVKDLHGVNVPPDTGGTIANSDIGDVNDSSNQPLTVVDDTIDGGNDTAYSPMIATGTGSIVVERIDASNGGHGVLCYSNCTVKDSWLHDNSTSSPTAHQNGIFLGGGSNNTIAHNSVGCVSASGCTADIGALDSTNNGPQVNELFTQNLLIQSPPSLGAGQTGYCVYPGPDQNPEAFRASGVVWRDNVFQKGPNGKCARNGPVYGWWPSTCSPNPCTWTNNTWDDGTELKP